MLIFANSAQLTQGHGTICARRKEAIDVGRSVPPALRRSGLTFRVTGERCSLREQRGPPRGALPNDAFARGRDRFLDFDFID